MNKCLALLRNVYDDDHGFKITVTEQNGNIYSKYYRMIDYLKAYKYFEYASNHFILKGDHRIYHKDVKIKKKIEANCNWNYSNSIYNFYDTFTFD